MDDKRKAQLILVFLNEAYYGLDKMAKAALKELNLSEEAIHGLEHVNEALFVAAYGITEITGDEDIVLDDATKKELDDLKDRAWENTSDK